MPDRVLLTGATGFLGSELICELLTRTDAHVVCLVRGEGDAGARERVRDVMVRMLGHDGWAAVDHRVSAVRGDVTLSRLGMSTQSYGRLVEDTTHIIHGAATVRFDMRDADARRINVAGTARMLDLAEQAARRGRLRRFGYVSTAFVAGRHPAVFGEEELDLGQPLRNSYERSKLAAEIAVRDRRHTVPVTVVRPSIVVGSATTGITRGFNVVYWPLRMYADGVLRYAPVRPDLSVDLVPVDVVAAGTVAAVLGAGREGATYCLAAGPRATTARRIAEVAADVFGVSPAILLSTPLDRWVLPAITRLIGVVPRLPHATAYAQYLPYFLHASRFDTTHGDSLLAESGIVHPPIGRFLRTILEFAQVTDFGRNVGEVRRRERLAARRRAAGLPYRVRALSAAPAKSSTARQQYQAATER